MSMRRSKGFWRDTIRKALVGLGGEADMSPDIYGEIEKRQYLTPRELSDSPHGGRPRFVHTVRGVASDMVNDRELIRVARGRFRLP